MSKRNKWLGIGLALLAPVVVAAANLSIPNTFTPGTPIRSSEVNANFAAVQSAVNSKLDSSQATFIGSARLAAFGYRTSDGATTGWGFFDRTLGTNCSPAPATDGTMRCMPGFVEQLVGYQGVY